MVVYCVQNHQRLVMIPAMNAFSDILGNQMIRNCADAQAGHLFSAKMDDI